MVEVTLGSNSDDIGRKVSFKMNNKKKIKWIIISALVLVLIAGGVVGVVYGIPAYQNYRSYQSAEKMLEAGQYEEAKNAFWALGTYKDSAQRIKKCDYEIAKQYLQEKKFDDAKQRFEELGDYSDSAAQIKACEYGRAEKYLSMKEYETAKSMFEKLGNYKDSEDKIKECQYGLAENLMQKEDYSNAKSMYESLGDYKDSKKKCKECEKIEQKANARKAYLEFLEENEYVQDGLYYSRFFLCDLNKDGIEELVTETTNNGNGGAEGAYLYTFKDGKMKKVIGCAYRTYYSVYPKAGVILEEACPGGPVYTTYRLFGKKGTAPEKASYVSGEWDEAAQENVDIYRIDGKKVSKGKYEKYVKKLVGSEKASDPYVENTSANREDVFGAR